MSGLFPAVEIACPEGRSVLREKLAEIELQRAQTEDAQFLEWKKKQETDQAMTALAIRNAGPRLQGTLSNLQR